MISRKLRNGLWVFTGFGFACAAPLLCAMPSATQPLWSGPTLAQPFAEPPMSGQRAAARLTPVSYLGIDVKAINEDQVAALRVKDNHGAAITRVDHDAPAGKMDLRVHDVVLQMNGITIENVEQLRKMMHDCPPGKMVVMTINRDGQQITTSSPMADRLAVERDAWAQHVGGGPGMPGPQAPEMALPSGDLATTSLSASAAPVPNTRYSKSFLGTLLTSPTYTGAMLEVMRPQLAQFFGVPTGSGLLVSTVEDNSPAALAGLKAGDVIVRANLKPMATPGNWARIIRESKGKPVTIEVLRDRQEKSLTLTPDIKRKASLDLPQDAPDAVRMACLTEL